MQRQKVPLRRLTAAERKALEEIARASSERADRVARATALLAVAAGKRFTDAARVVGRRSGDAVAQLVARFTTEGLARTRGARAAPRWWAAGGVRRHNARADP